MRWKGGAISELTVPLRRRQPAIRTSEDAAVRAFGARKSAPAGAAGAAGAAGKCSSSSCGLPGVARA
ncbi:MAG: hypothetical protein ACLQDY_09915 [Streptosporangiaceae bacterium]